MEPYKKYQLFDDAGNNAAALKSLGRTGEGNVDARIIEAANGPMFNLNSESMIEAVYPYLKTSGPRNPINDPSNEDYNGLYWALSSIINERIDALVKNGTLIAVWESSGSIPSWLTPGKLSQLKAFGFVEQDADGYWTTTEESEFNFFRRYNSMDD